HQPSGASGCPPHGRAARFFPNSPFRVLAMNMTLHLQDLRLAWEARDPELVLLIEALALQPDEPSETPVREGAPTFAGFLAEMRSWRFKRQSKEEQAHY